MDVVVEVFEVVVLEVVTDDVILLEVAVVVVVPVVLVVTVAKFAVIVPGPLITTEVGVDSGPEVDIELMMLQDSVTCPNYGRINAVVNLLRALNNPIVVVTIVCFYS